MRGFPAPALPTSLRPCAAASASAMTDQIPAGAGKILRHRTAGNTGSPPSARTASRPKDRACVSGWPGPPSAVLATEAGRDRHHKQRQTDLRETANPAPVPVSLAHGRDLQFDP